MHQIRRAFQRIKDGTEDCLHHRISSQRIGEPSNMDAIGGSVLVESSTVVSSRMLKEWLLRPS